MRTSMSVQAHLQRWLWLHRRRKALEICVWVLGGWTALGAVALHDALSPTGLVGVGLAIGLAGVVTYVRVRLDLVQIAAQFDRRHHTGGLVRTALAAETGEANGSPSMLAAVVERALPRTVEGTGVDPFRLPRSPVLLGACGVVLSVALMQPTEASPVSIDEPAGALGARPLPEQREARDPLVPGSVNARVRGNGSLPSHQSGDGAVRSGGDPGLAQSLADAAEQLSDQVTSELDRLAELFGVAGAVGGAAKDGNGGSGLPSPMRAPPLQGAAQPRAPSGAPGLSDVGKIETPAGLGNDPVQPKATPVHDGDGKMEEGTDGNREMPRPGNPNQRPGAGDPGGSTMAGVGGVNQAAGSDDARWEADESAAEPFEAQQVEAQRQATASWGAPTRQTEDGISGQASGVSWTTPTDEAQAVDEQTQRDRAIPVVRKDYVRRYFDAVEQETP